MNDEYSLVCGGKTEYWDSFYGEKKPQKNAPLYPSQFSAFAVNEFVGVDGVVEYGCGNGRDSEFFSLYGLDVLAFDASAEAIRLCKSLHSGSSVKYLNKEISESGDEFDFFVSERKRIAVYARFFLHAITREEESKFFSILKDKSPSGTVLLFEYRTVGDECVEKEFGEHYRRYLNHSELVERLAASGFDVEYQVEGFGFAKYKHEDARVGRCVAYKK